MVQVLYDQNEFEVIKDKQSSFYLLKHSLTCPISANALKEYKSFSDTTDEPCYVLYVQESRPLSNYIQEEFNIRHESPQALYFNEGSIIWDASHSNINVSTLQHALEQF
ncbi:bacillithiol system redox-active protein YtxJ [Halobacillus sp. Marseille-P3879]|uniref:bacillithiol system redox-active protein YtxJ n=1 Tax=Halobacillus sp. Marseille-P3879 TaxID=2045014 RepID=UPI000C7C2BCD|nr:bacillithiol system redox-active protein YtxJ [Halobacillus sp. Marseille-P3879]